MKPGSAGRWPAPSTPDQRNGNESPSDAVYQAYVLTKIQQGRADIQAGRHYTTAEARARLANWLSR